LLEFYSQLDINILITEVRDFINGQLREIMIEKLYKRLIQGKINQINQLDLITENISKIRISIKEYFKELEKWTLIMKNFGEIIKSEFDKNNFVVYDEIMEIVNYF
jgi:hypothetical protein